MILIEERELVLLESVEELLPRDFLEALVGLGEVDAQDTTRTPARFRAAGSGVGDAGRAAAALLDPLTDGVVIGGLLR